MTDAVPDDTDFEGLLQQALAPVDPPARFSERVEARLASLTETAMEELEAWELSAMRDPRNWVRPVVAATVAATAGGALVLVRARARHRRRAGRPSDPLDFAGRTLRDLADEARRLVRRD